MSDPTCHHCADPLPSQPHVHHYICGPEWKQPHTCFAPAYCGAECCVEMRRELEGQQLKMEMRG